MENMRSEQIDSVTTENAINQAFLLAKSDHLYQALALLNEHYPLILMQGNIEGQLRALRVYSYTYGHLGLVEASLKSNQEGLNLIKIHGIDLTLEDNTPLKFMFLNNMASDYASLHRFEEALQLYQEAKACIDETMGESYVLVLNNISECYIDARELDLAIGAAERALKMAENMASNASILNHCHYTFGTIYKEKRMIDQAMAHFYKSLQFAEKEETRYHIVEVKIAIGKLYLEQGDYQAALTYLVSASEIATEINAHDHLRELELLVANTYEAIGDFEKANQYLKAQLANHKRIMTNEIDQKMTVITTENHRQKVAKEGELYKLRNIEMTEKKQELESKERALEAAYNDLAILSRIGNVITSSMAIEKVLQAIYDNLQGIIKANVFGVAFYSSTEKTLDYRLLIEEGVRVPSFQLSVANNEGYAAQCIFSRKPILENALDVTTYKMVEHSPDTRVTKYPKSLIYLPMIIGGKVIGVLTVQSYEENAYCNRDLDKIRILATYIMIAINKDIK